MTIGEVIYRIAGAVLAPIIAVSFAALFLTAFFLALPILLIVELGTIYGVLATIAAIAPFLVYHWIGDRYFNDNSGCDWQIDWALGWTFGWAAVIFLLYHL